MGLHAGWETNQHFNFIDKTAAKPYRKPDINSPGIHWNSLEIHPGFTRNLNLNLKLLMNNKCELAYAGYTAFILSLPLGRSPAREDFV